jgi:hypothetical protein
MHISRAKRTAAARKAARTRARNKTKRRAAARRATITRRRKRITVSKKSSIKKSPL